MKRIICPLTLWLLLQVLLTGCGEREKEEIPENFCEVGINLNWEGITSVPEGVEVLFYRQDNTNSKPTTTYLPAKGGKTNLKPGIYKVVIFNYDTEAVQIRGTDKLETLEAYTGPCTGFVGENTTGMVWEPDPIYVARLDLTIEEKEKEKALDVKPQLIPQTCSFEIKVKGLEYVNSVSGSVSGVAASYLLGLGHCSTETCTVSFEMKKGDGVLKGKFCYFGVPHEAARAFSFTQLITIKVVRRDNSVQEVKVDVTEAIQNANTPGDNPGTDPGENPGGSSGGSIDIEIKEEIEIPYVPPTPSEDGGIGGDVGEWGDEEEVVIPMK